MPWQTVPSLLIIGGAFNAAAGLMWGLDRLYYGRVSTIGFLRAFAALCDGVIT